MRIFTYALLIGSLPDHNHGGDHHHFKFSQPDFAAAGEQMEQIRTYFWVFLSQRALKEKYPKTPLYLLHLLPPWRRRR